MSSVTVRSKKEDILNAYQELLKQMQDNAETSETRKTAIMRKQEDVTVEKASSLSPETILKGISNLEGDMRKWFGELGEKLLNELRKLSEVQEALLVEKKRLDELHAIQAKLILWLSLFRHIRRKK